MIATFSVENLSIVNYMVSVDNLNTQVCRSLKKSPYEVVFGQLPRASPFPEMSKLGDAIQEEDTPKLMEKNSKNKLYNKASAYTYFAQLCFQPV